MQKQFLFLKIKKWFVTNLSISDFLFYLTYCCLIFFFVATGIFVVAKVQTSVTRSAVAACSTCTACTAVTAVASYCKVQASVTAVAAVAAVAACGVIIVFFYVD
jgi:hypothetical protein